MRTALLLLFLLTCSALNITNTNSTMSDSAEIELTNIIVGSVIGGVVGCICIACCVARFFRK